MATDLGAASGGLAVAAGVAVALAGEGSGVLLAEVGAERGRAPTVLASRSARELEDRLRDRGFGLVAARGRLCWLCLPAGEDGVGELASALDAADTPLAVAHLPAAAWLGVLEHPALRVRAGLLRADLPAERATAALAAMELRERGICARIASRPLGRVAARRALAGLEPGGGAGRRIARLARGLSGRVGTTAAERGQSLPMVIGAAFAILFVATVLAAIGGAITAAARAQRAVDLVALSGARSLRDDFARLFVPARLPGGAPNPKHLDKPEYLARAAVAAREAAARNNVDPRRVRVSFPDMDSFAPLRVRAAIGSGEHAVAEASPPAAEQPQPVATGDDYPGPFAYRQGKPMRPDVAAAFDRLAAAAQRAGISLVINSAYRSDAEQAQLFAEHPDPRWVAPPGQSLHRCATELDLGPSSASGWLEQNAGSFGFLQRYAWEAWHFGYTRGPAPCSAAGNAVGASGGPGGEREPSQGLPGFVPADFRVPIENAAAHWNVSAGLLAAQLMAESNFNPFAISPAGAQGIAQFMPGTAASYGLRDPFDAPAAIDAQAHLMSDLLQEFGSVSLALAAYNAGPAPVAACGCVPDIPETQAYVARILGFMGGAGELPAPTLEVRLVS